MEKDKIVPKSAGKSQKAEWVIEQAKLSLSNYIKMVGWLISFGRKMKQLTALLTVFLMLFLSVAFISVSIFAGIYRIRHITTDVGIFSDSATVTDSPFTFYYISIREFMGGEPYDLVPVAPAARLPLMAESATQFFLMVIVILTFSTVTQRKARETSESYENRLQLEAEKLIEQLNPENLVKMLTHTNVVHSLDSGIDDKGSKLNYTADRVVTLDVETKDDLRPRSESKIDSASS
jgi:hypothetical protein